MLSNDTRKIIDDARNTLVGQIPVPMMQCQQITLALTYKFMSDDDQAAVGLGGRPHYFTGELERYSWDKIMSLRLDDTQRSELYRAGLGALQESDTMPAVFREIFKDAVVPFGDHRTLALFLNTMDRMVYDDSEKLGDAYEYLLKTAEAQADAGQFRTPRHIIDFIVKIINPQKHEVIIDPACGTAGFLVSAYQHVKSQHELPGGGSSLSVPDLTRLADNLKGYDISPEMTKLAMANMYLHTQDKDPNIDNYDTLTSTDHWNEYADVMLANPPFMTPKGGIKPHTRFRVPATRAEVLFVDYIASHLNEHGRAGIIVPEGIIFQSQNAYRQLRRFLLDESLVAVISLPGGVFQPYSGVKTSILILDKVLAPKTEYVGFFKVENDGLDLGAQRRPIEKDDLPAVFDEVSEFLRRVRAGDALDASGSNCGRVVAKSKIAADGEYNLSGERYSVAELVVTQWPVVKLAEACDINPDTVVPETQYPNLTIFYADISSVSNGDGMFLGYAEVASSSAPSRARRGIRKGDVLLSTVRPNLKAFTILREVPERAVASTGFAVLRARPDIAEPGFILALMRSDESVRQMVAMMGKGSYPSINQSDVASINVPLPPLQVQREIVAEIEGYQRVMDGARAVVDHWRPRFAVDPEWPLVPLGGLCALGGSVTKDVDLNLPYFGADSIESGSGKLTKVETAEAQGVSGPVFEFDGERLLYSKIRPYLNKLAVVDVKGYCSSDMYPLVPDQSKIAITYLATYMLSKEFNDGIRHYYERANIPKINRSQLFQVAIPVPDLGTQNSIVAEIEAERALASANRELVERMEQHIQDVIVRVWEG